MRNASLKFKRYAASIQAISNAEKFMLRAVLFSFGAIAIWYIIILGTIVFNITERKTAESKIRTLSSEVSDLELGYLAKSNSIDLSLSYSMGFQEVSPKFATRKNLTSLGMNSDALSLNIRP